MTDCVFCRIVRNEAPCHKIWEDEKHLAFLSIRPNTEGFSVVVTKGHYPSYVVDLPNDVLCQLMMAAKQVTHLLDQKLEDVGRTGIIFEGFGVNHAHAKLFPMHGTADTREWRPITASLDKYFYKYEGYISTHAYQRSDDHVLAHLAEKIKG